MDWVIRCFFNFSQYQEYRSLLVKTLFHKAEAALGKEQFQEAELLALILGEYCICLFSLCLTDVLIEISDIRALIGCDASRSQGKP